MWRLLVRGGDETRMMWDEVLPRVQKVITLLRYAERQVTTVEAYAGLAVKMVKLVTACALRIEEDYLQSSGTWSAHFEETETTLADVGGLNTLQSRLFEATYRVKVSALLGEVDSAVGALGAALAEIPTAEEDLAGVCDQLEAIDREIQGSVLEEAGVDDVSEVLAREVVLAGGDEAVLASNFLEKLRGLALEHDLAKDDIDLMRQLLAVSDDASLRGDVQRARRGVECEVEDDEDFLRSVVDFDEIQQHEEMRRRQIERDETREQLGREKILVEAVAAAVRLTSEPAEASTVYATNKAETDRLDAETAKLVAETAMLQLEEAHEDNRLDAKRRLYEQALQARQKAQARKFSSSMAIAMGGDVGSNRGSAKDGTLATESSVRERSDSFSSQQSSTIFSLGSIVRECEDDDDNVSMACSMLTRDPPTDNARRAKAAAKLSELCGGKNDEVSARRRSQAARRGALKALVAMLNMHVRQNELDAVARCLCALAAHHADNKAAILDAGALLVVVDRVADAGCDNRFLVPLWRALTNSDAYEGALLHAADTAVDHIVAVVEHSYVAEEQCLATEALFQLICATHHTFNALRALTGVLPRRLHDDAREAAKARVAKETATRAVVVILGFSAQDIFTVPGAISTIESLATAGRFFEGGGGEEDDAALAVIKSLYDFLVAESDTQMISILRIEDPTPAAWTAKEHCARALRRLIKAAEDSDKAAQGLAIDTNPHHYSVSKPPAASRSAQRVATALARKGILPPLTAVIKAAGAQNKRVVFAKQEAARVVRLLAEHERSLVDQFVTLDTIPALLALIEVVNKDDPKEAAVLALWSLCRDSKPNRSLLVNLPSGLKAVMQLVARTGTNPSDEASSRLLAALATDDPSLEKKIRNEKHLFNDMLRTLEWNVNYGDTVHVKAAAKALRDLMKPNSSEPTSIKKTPAKPSKAAKVGIARTQKKAPFSLFRNSRNKK
ncbi:hypothetical protein CTAYLR_009809 [Chrysophaeum taylorii]|uniref:Uncharacterized protein n=1 Tax=Chrysophaeum taylorii TaxID=2483200 RepID=A0AAD7U708_9STRA|nr:hypothetical protein CTAYLR_009809 [Chrysophaeum taylorii]